METRHTLPQHKSWYKTARWQKLRAQQLADFPLCAMCQPKRIKRANVCDHVTPHRGNEEKFWSGPFQSLCFPCHNGEKQRIEKGGKAKPRIAVDGWPEED